MSSCCAPSAEHEPKGESNQLLNQTPNQPRDGTSPIGSFVRIPGGRFRMGTETGGQPRDGEGPVHDVELAEFWIDQFAVSNDQFADFVDATGHKTEAEVYGWTFVFGGLLPDDFPPTRGVAAAPWWRQVEGADWKHPEGPQSSLTNRGSHPVVHVSWNDAIAYCEWSGTRLPTEAEWEYAARGGLEQQHWPWGEVMGPDDEHPLEEHHMNVFQGTFPADNTRADGFSGTCPVDQYEPNGYGLYNVCGNVWEWTSDWYAPDYYVHSPLTDPRGPQSGEQRVMRGGSYLCHLSYCNRYRVDSRSANTPDSSTGNLGFRVVRVG